MALLCGCDGNHSQSSNSKLNEIDTPIFSDFVGEYPENPISLLTKSEEEIRSEINSHPNFKCSDNLYVNIPENASVYEFKTYSIHVPQFDYPGAQYKNDFEEVFKYLFPDREINPDYLQYSKYLGYDHEKGCRIEDKGYVKDKAILPDGVEFTYNEMPERTAEWNSPIYLELVSEIGGGAGDINKGETVYLAGKKDYDDWNQKVVSSDTYNTLRLFYPGYYFENVGKYSPKSEKSFKLLDGEMKICDAVNFFENYINNIPISTGLQRNVRTSVYNVIVLKIGDDTYGFYFNTRPQFQGVNYEPMVTGVMSKYSYEPTGGDAFMIRSGDVDIINGFFGNKWTFDVSTCEKILPVETAIKNISDKLSDSVTFEVDTVEFVYVQQFVKDELGHIDINKYEAHITPAWRITAGNLNDNRIYMCYVDAKDGGNFRYYTTPGITKYD